MNATETCGDGLESAARLSSELRLVLARGVGPRLRRMLLDRFGNAKHVLDAAPDQLRSIPGVGPKLLARILQARQSTDQVQQMIETCRDHDVAILLESSNRYPRCLREISDPPGVLFHQGKFLSQDALSIAVVGTRHSTPYGLRQAERLAGGLARLGFTIVSGLARGIDAAAHRAALAVGGRTIAVLGSGLLNVYPPEHLQLAQEVAQQGVLVSELPPECPPHSVAFPRRNRLITGLSLGVIVVEASLRSGALISARHALEQNREVFAVPGQVDRRTARGCHQLIRDGAKLVENIDDVLQELGPLIEAASDQDGRSVHHPAEMQLNDQERAVLVQVQAEPTDIQQIADQAGLPIHRVLSTISVLEMKRMIRRVSGTRVLRV